MTIALDRRKLLAGAAAVAAAGFSFPMPALASGPRSRFTLDAPTTMWFDPSGIDTNDGLDISRPKKTLQNAWETAAFTFDLAGQDLTFKSKTAATYFNAGLTTSAPLVGQRSVRSVVIDGNGCGFIQNNGTASPLQSYSFMVGDIYTGEGAVATRFEVRNASFASPDGGAINSNGGTIVLGPGLIFGTVSLCHLNVSGPSANILALAGYKVAGNAAVHANCFGPGGMLVLQSLNNGPQGKGAIDFMHGAMNFPYGFVSANYLGCVYGAFSQFLNAENVSGQKFTGTMKSLVQGPLNGDLNYFPGSIPGTVDATSTYQ